MKHNTFTCSSCSRSHNDRQEGRCPSCDNMINADGSLVLFNLVAKPVNPKYFTGEAPRIGITEAELRSALGCTSYPQEDWKKLINLGALDMGVLTYEWTQIAH